MYMLFVNVVIASRFEKCFYFYKMIHEMVWKISRCYNVLKLVTVGDEYLRTFYIPGFPDIVNLYLVHRTEWGCCIGLRAVTVYGTECFHG